MKRRFFPYIILFMLCASFLFMQSHALEANSPVKIGVVFGSNAKPSSNLQNVSGKGRGYSFGYYNKTTYNFTSLANSNETEITIVKNKPIYIGTGNTYYDTAPANTIAKIGPYSLQCDRVYYSAAEAQSACDALAFNNYSAYVAYVDNQYRVRIGSYFSQQDAENDKNPVAAAALDALTVISPSSTCYTVTKTGTSNILFQFDSGNMPLGIMPQTSDGASQTWSKGYKYFGGFEYYRANGNDISVINVVNINDYLKGVVPYEMSPSWPFEALKAQALCAKAYCLNNAGRHANEGFDLCNTTDCQVYQGTNNSSARSDMAVEDTRNLSIKYNGKNAQTYYHSSSGGWTENSENIWGGNIPYLRAVEDIYLTHTKPWTYSVSAAEIASILRAKGTACTSVTDIYVSELTRAGNVRGITIVIDGKPVAFTGEKARTILNSSSNNYAIKSHRFTVSATGGASSGSSSIYVNGAPLDGALDSKYAVGNSGTPTKIPSGTHYAISKDGKTELYEGNSGTSSGELSFNFAGTGSGHHIGMSQWGAYDMAMEGFLFDSIIKFYFTGVQVE